MTTPTFETVVRDLRTSFNNGKTRSLAWRKAQLKALLSLLESSADLIVDASKKDLRRSKFETTMLEIDSTKNEVLCALENLETWSRPEKPEKGLVNLLDELYIYKDPLGVVLIIGAWNYPFLETFEPLVGAIASGNCAILKPSELSPVSAQLIETLVSRFLDPSCFRVVQGGPSETSALIANKFDHIFYTGSSNVGRIIYEAAAKNLTPVTLELGGKSPLYMDDSVHMPTAARRILWGKFINMGQTCVAPDYILCTKEVEAKFVEEAKKVLDEWYSKDKKGSPDLARIVNRNHFNRLRKFLENRENVVAGGDFDESELFISPTIVGNVSRDDPLMADELFGPILPIVSVRNIDEAISYINSRPKPLTLYIFSSQLWVQEQFLSRTSSGSVACNECVVHLATDTLPFGGVGNSGTGSYHGKFSFDTFTHQKAVLKKGYNGILESLGALRYPPYSDGKLKKLLGLTQRRTLWFPTKLVLYSSAFLLGVVSTYLVMHFNGNKGADQ